MIFEEEKVNHDNITISELQKFLPLLSDSPPESPSPSPIPSPQKLKQTNRSSPNAKNLAPVFEALYQKYTPKVCEETLSNLDTLTIEYHGRNILDLGNNIEWNWSYRPSKSDFTEPNLFKFSEVNGRFTIVKKVREKNGRYYFFYPYEN